ncbi:hypothetical protein [Burkholderia cepacia]|uniref:hypothetical protein n=1 Tax=Burkholderia cepacia TaxID=292 RepID=UPI000AE84D2C|nr:hypothetical protein [Burkholderia cepacia]
MAFIQYNQIIRLGNDYKGQNNGGYLGVGPASNISTLAKDMVGTYKSYQGNDIPTQWKIEVLVTTGDGTYVHSGDRVKLKSVSDGYYLALFNNTFEGDSGYSVATAQDTSDPGNINANNVTTSWSIFVNNPSGAGVNDSRVDDVNPVILIATFNRTINASTTGPFSSVLDTNNYAPSSTGLYIQVTGARLLNRDKGSGAWQATIAQSLT